MQQKDTWKDLTHRNNLSRMVREKEKSMVEHRIEMHQLLEKEEWLGDKENYLAYHDSVWWMAHDATVFAMMKIWKDALSGKDESHKFFSNMELTDLYMKTEELANRKPNWFEKLMKGFKK